MCPMCVFQVFQLDISRSQHKICHILVTHMSHVTCMRHFTRVSHVTDVRHGRCKDKTFGAVAPRSGMFFAHTYESCLSYETCDA